MTKTNDKKPTHTIWQVIGDGPGGYWNKIGAAWPNKDGKGYNLRLDSIPLTGHTTMRIVREKHGDQVAEDSGSEMEQPAEAIEPQNE